MPPKPTRHLLNVKKQRPAANIPLLTQKVVKQSYSEYKKEKAKLMGNIPTPPHMLMNAISFNKDNSGEKYLRYSNLGAETGKENSEKLKLLPSCYDINVRTGADLRGSRAQVQSLPLRDIKNEVISKLGNVFMPNQFHRQISFKTDTDLRPSRPSLSKRIGNDQLKVLNGRIEAEIKRRNDETLLLERAMLAMSKVRGKTKSLPGQNIRYISTVSCPLPRIKEMAATRTFTVTLLEMTSPSQFVFQFNQKELQVLTQEMTLYYNAKKGDMKIPKSALSRGQTVAMFKGGIWYRVEIVYTSDDDAFVHYVDLGCNRKAKITDFSHLTEKFATPTRKACKGCLFGVKPPGTDILWSPEAIMAFMSKTKGQKILATVKAVAYKTFELSLIYDGMRNLTVEDYLVSRKLAQSTSENKPTMNAVLY